MAKPIAHENEWDTFARLASHGRAIERLQRRSAGPWQYVGDPNKPDFQNGWENQGGGLQRMRYRFLLGGGIEIQGSITGGSYGTVAFQLPVGYRPDDGELRLAASDDNNQFIVFRVLANGNVIPDTP